MRGCIPATSCKRDRAENLEVFTIATFTNQATLSYSGGITNSNIVTGEITDVLSAAKTPVSLSYAPGENVTYAVSLVNGGDAAISGVTVTDDLGSFAVGEETVYPLEYNAGSLLYFQDGVLQADPAVTAGPPLAVSGIDIPAGGSVLLLYEARVTEYAPLDAGSEITNTAVVSGPCADINATAVLPVESSEPELTISKSVSPAVVAGCSELTYTFVIQNSGRAEAAAADAVVVTDTFVPVLSGLTVELDDTEIAAGTDYTYDETSGAFATAAGRITVPAATYAQNPDGTWVVTPGVTVLTVRGTV